MSEILISILIPSIPSRLDKLTALISKVEAQAHPQVEVLVYLDNKKRALGFKRNNLMDQAQGKFLCHIDDDDTVSERFVELLIPECAHDVDLIAYDADCSLNGAPPFRVFTGIDFDNEQPKHLIGGGYSSIRRKPWHWCAWRKEIAIQCKFPEWHDGAEDAYWLRQAWPLVKRWKKIDEILFHHRFSAKDSTFSIS